MLLYIHGYQGSPGEKFDRVVKIFGGLYSDIRAPQLSNMDVASDLAQLRGLLSDAREEGQGAKYPHLIVGNSLGGFYAWHLCRQRRDSMCLLINPALAPFITLNRDDGATPDFLRDLLHCFLESYLNCRFPRTWTTYCRDDELITHEATTVPVLRGSEGAEATFFPVAWGGHGFTNTEALEAAFETVKQDIQKLLYPDAYPDGHE